MEKADFDFSKPPSIPDLASGEQQPPKPEELKSHLKTAGKRFMFGPGLGRTAATVGTIVAFPPYAIYVLGNAGLALFGYEPLYVTNLLPEPARKKVLGVYDGITSVPGRVVAGASGQEYQSGKKE